MTRANTVKTTEQYRAEIRKLNDQCLVIGEYITAHTKIKHKCLQCNSVCSASPNNVLRSPNGFCKKCRYARTAHTRNVNEGARYAEKLAKYTNGTVACVGTYVDGYTPIQHLCTKHAITFMCSPNTALHNSSSCSACVKNSYARANLLSVKEIRKKVGSRFVSCVYRNNKRILRLHCSIHGEYSPTSPYPWNHKHFGCSLCVRAFSGSVKTRQVRIKGKNFLVQGYEDKAIRWIITNTGTDINEIETDLSGGRIAIPYKYDGKIRQYHPDISIQKQRRLVEVKSTYTLTANTEVWRKNKAKAAAAIKAGYRFTLLVMSSKGERVPVPKSWHTLRRIDVIRYWTDLGLLS